MKKTMFVLLTALVSYSSVSHASGFGRKYSQIQTSSDTFIITIGGKPSTTLDKAWAGLMTRASEVTINHGYNYFVITSSSNEVLGKPGFFFQEMPGRSITIKCFKEKPNAAEVTDAHFFLKNKTS